nr:MAG TPA: hypothetical protein [Caudoviricetes sp.]
MRTPKDCSPLSAATGRPPATQKNTAGSAVRPRSLTSRHPGASPGRARNPRNDSDGEKNKNRRP